MMLMIIAVPKFTFELLFAFKNFLKMLIQGQKTSNPGGWIGEGVGEHFLDSSNHTLGNH